MECSVITTYRCNARCQMCNIWQHPSDMAEEFAPGLLARLPGGLERLCITGGEAMLRDDIIDIVEILSTKAAQLEISTNGYYTERIVELCRRFPHIIVRVSVEGLPRVNDEVRGLTDGFDHALRTVLRLKAMGIRNVGFGIVIADYNCQDLLDLYALCAAMGLELGSAAPHNSFYFHKHDNRIDDVKRVDAEMRRFVRALLTSRRRGLRVKDWGRAYLNMGLVRYMRGEARPLPCGAGTDSFFLSPWGEILACNGSPEPWVMGDLRKQSFAEVWHSRQAEEARQRVRACRRHCWMTGSAVPAMRRRPWVPLWWVLRNKARLYAGREVAEL